MADLQLLYPQCSREELKQIQKEEKKRIKFEDEERIRNHDILVYRFAQFLDSCKIAVAYEGLLSDFAVTNYMKWFQEQMNDSDYIFLIITDSFCHFLSNEPPEDKERIFSGEFLHNFVNKGQKKPILPIFLNRRSDPNLLPDALRSSSTYHVAYSEHPPHFNVQQSQLDRLYALLTRQNRIQPPRQVSVVPVVSGLQRRGK